MAGHDRRAVAGGYHVARRRDRPSNRAQEPAPCQGSIVVAAIETGLIEEARAALAQMRRLHPEWAAGGKPFPWFLRRPEHLARFEKAFSLAQRLDVVAASGGLTTPSATPS